MLKGVIVQQSSGTNYCSMRCSTSVVYTTQMLTSSLGYGIHSLFEIFSDQILYRLAGDVQQALQAAEQFEQLSYTRPRPAQTEHSTKTDRDTGTLHRRG